MVPNLSQAGEMARVVKVANDASENW